MRDLVESIANNRLVESQDIFQSILSDILEQKLYERKQQIDLTEATKSKKVKHSGEGYSKEYWDDYRKRTKSYGFYDTPSGKAKPPEGEGAERNTRGGLTKQGINVRREKRGYVQAGPAIRAKKFIDAVNDHLQKQIDAKNKAASKKLSEAKKVISPFVQGAQDAAAETKRRSAELNAVSSSDTSNKSDSENDTNNKSKKNRKVPPKGVGAGSDAASQADNNPYAAKAKQSAPPQRSLSRADRRDVDTMRAKRIDKANGGGTRALDRVNRTYDRIDRANRNTSIAKKVAATFLGAFEEELSPNAKAGDYIHDFVHSKNKTFKGHSKKLRIKQALAAYYAKQRGN